MTQEENIVNKFNEILQDREENENTIYTDEFLRNEIQKRIDKLKKQYDNFGIEVYDSHNTIFSYEKKCSKRKEDPTTIVYADFNDLTQEIQTIIQIIECM